MNKLKQGDKIKFQGHTLEVISVSEHKVIATDGVSQFHIPINNVTKIN